MKFYIATKFEAVKEHNTVRDLILARNVSGGPRNYELTYDWTNQPLQSMRTNCLFDVRGVVDADLLVVLLRDGFHLGIGTHTELGIAIGWNEVAIRSRIVSLQPKHIFLWTDRIEAQSSCPFYWAEESTFVTCSWELLPQELGEYLDWLES